VIGAVGAGLGPLGGAAFGAASGALMGAGMSVIEDKAKGKPVDWSKAGREAVKGGITGAVTGALTGGLGNLKKIADAASKMTKIEKAAEAAKATRLAQKAAEAGALASKWHKVKTAVATQGRNIGASMKESKIAEDMIKDTLSGGLNNVMGYYMDDTVKDKSVMGGIGMFISGAGASAIGSRYSGGLKTGMGVSGYSGDIARVGIRGRATDVFTGAVADTGGGFIKTSVQYTTDKAVLGRQLDWDEYIDKVATGAIKDFSKSSVKGAVKMDAGVAGKYRDRVAYPMYQVAEAVQNPVGAVNQMINNMFSTSVIMKAIK
jgi:rhs family protein